MGEADKIFTLLTQARGKIDAVAKGVRRTKSHFAGRLEFMTEATLTLHRGRNLDVITSAQTVRSHWEAIVQPAAFATASLFGELVDVTSEHDLAIPDVYDLLRGALAALGDQADPTVLIARFELRLLHALGVAPPDDVCVRGGEALAGGAWLDAQAGGLVCQACSRGAMLELAAADLQNFRALGAARGAGRTAALVATPRTARAVDELMWHHLGKRPKAHVLLDALTR